MNKEEAIQKMINEKRWRLPDDVFSDAGYVSPIKQIVSDWQMTMEENVMKAVRQVDIHVDKEELIKALQYDREQYAKGFTDGYAQGIEMGKNIVIEELNRSIENRFKRNIDVKFMAGEEGDPE